MTIGWKMTSRPGIRRIEISFPVSVELPPGFERVLIDLVDMVCQSYVRDHPTRTMWPAGVGAKPLWREPEEPEFDAETFQIECAEREASEKDLERRGFEILPTDCTVCGEIQFKGPLGPSCPNGHTNSPGMIRTVIHILFEGLSLCRFTTEVPGKWPEGHKWVSPVHDAAEAATCRKCLSTFRKYIKGRDADSNYSKPS